MCVLLRWPVSENRPANRVKSPRPPAAAEDARSERHDGQCLEHGARGKRTVGQRGTSWRAAGNGESDTRLGSAGARSGEGLKGSGRRHVADETQEFLEQMRSRFSADAVEERARQSLSREVCEKREEVHALADRAL